MSEAAEVQRQCLDAISEIKTLKNLYIGESAVFTSYVSPVATAPLQRLKDLMITVPARSQDRCSRFCPKLYFADWSEVDGTL